MKPRGSTTTWQNDHFTIKGRTVSGSLSLNPTRLHRELARRGWHGIDLARAAQLTAPTISAALAGRPLKMTTVRKIAKTLSETPPIAVIHDLIREAADEPAA